MGKQETGGKRRQKEREELGWGLWLNQSVTKLVTRGHSVEAISNYDLDQFVLFLDAAQQIEAEERTNFVVDISTAIGQLFNKEPIVQTHLDLLNEIKDGVKNGSGKRTRRNSQRD